jgi:Ion channel
MTPSSPQEVAVLIPLALGLMAALMTIGIHAVALGAIAKFVRRAYKFRRAAVGFWTDVVIVAGVILLALIAHLLGIAIWAVLYEACGEFTGLASAFYHSAMNYTSLGYGDVVMSASWRLFGPLEAAVGLLMFGVSTAMIFALIQQLFRTRGEAARTAHTGH